MSQTQLFTNETTEGFSAAIAVSGHFTVHARGVFDRQAGTVIRGWISPTGIEDYQVLADLQFFKPGSKNIEVEGSLKFSLSNPGNVNLWIEGPI